MLRSDRSSLEEALSIGAGVASAREERDSAASDPGFDADRLAELGLFAKKGEQSRTSPVPMKLIIIDSHTALIDALVRPRA